MAVLDTLSTVQDQALEGIRIAQDATVEAARTVVEAVAPVVPSLVRVPFADQIPEPKAVVDQAYGFASEVLETNRRFAEQLAAQLSDVVGPRPPAPGEAPTTTTTRRGSSRSTSSRTGAPRTGSSRRSGSKTTTARRRTTRAPRNTKA